MNYEQWELEFLKKDHEGRLAEIKSLEAIVKQEEQRLVDDTYDALYRETHMKYWQEQLEHAKYHVARRKELLYTELRQPSSLTLNIAALPGRVLALPFVFLIYTWTWLRCLGSYHDLKQNPRAYAKQFNSKHVIFMDIWGTLIFVLVVWFLFWF